MHAPTASLCKRDWSVWGQICTKQCSRLALALTEADLHLLQHKDLSVGDLESSLQLLARQDGKMLRIEQLG